MIAAIETRYAGCHFRSRLEARWAVFFDALDITWEYEPQGFTIPRSDGSTTPYLPDFLLPQCSTWVEVKGAEDALDRRLMADAAQHLPEVPGCTTEGPRLMILGPIPQPTRWDYGWLGLSPFDDSEDRFPGLKVLDHWWGFGGYVKSGRPWVLTETSSCTPFVAGDGEMPWLVPAVDTSVPYESQHAYVAARSARFEHGESGA